MNTLSKLENAILDEHLQQVNEIEAAWRDLGVNTDDWQKRLPRTNEERRYWAARDLSAAEFDYRLRNCVNHVFHFYIPGDEATISFYEARYNAPIPLVVEAALAVNAIGIQSIGETIGIISDIGAPKLSDLRFDILQLCASQDSIGVQGLPAWACRNLKDTSKRALNWLIEQGYVKYGVFGNAITTEIGYNLYLQQMER